MQSMMFSKRKMPEQGELSMPTKFRIMADIAKAKKELLPGIYMYPDEKDITKFHALIEGPEGTPYAGGYFYFFLRFPSDYPMSPPSVSACICIAKCIVVLICACAAAVANGNPSHNLTLFAGQIYDYRPWQCSIQPKSV